MALNLDLRRLADSLAAATDPEVASVAAGQSGPLPRVFGLSEGVSRARVRSEAEAEAAEAQQGQPSMVDQYLQMYQQAMSGGPPQPPQGMPQGMPPQMPQGMPQGQMPRQMPPGMPQGPPPSQQGIGSMMPPQQPPRRPMPQGMPQGMPPGMGQGMPQGPPPQMGMARGGLVRGYAGSDGSHVVGEMPAQNPISGPQVGEEGMPEESDEEIIAAAADDPGMLMEAIEWVKENPGQAAIYGINAASFASMAVPVGGWAAAAGLRGTSWAWSAALKLGPKFLKFAKNPVQTVGKYRMGRARAGFDSGVDGASRARAMEQRLNMPNAMRTTIKGERVPRTDAEMVTKLGRNVVYPAAGAALGLSTNFLGGEDEEVPVGDAAAAVGGGGGGNVDPSTYAAPGYLMGSDAPQEFGAMTEDKMNPPGFFDNISNAGWMGIINAGLSLAAPQGDSQGFGQDLANAAKSGLGTFTEQTDSDRERDIMLEQSEYDISQRGAVRESQRASIALANAQAENLRTRAGERMNPRQAMLTAQAHFDADDADIDPMEVNKLARYYQQYGLEGLDIYRGENAQISTLTDDPSSGWSWSR